MRASDIIHKCLNIELFWSIHYKYFLQTLRLHDGDPLLGDGSLGRGQLLRCVLLPVGLGLLREVPHPLLAVLLEEGSHHVGVVASQASTGCGTASFSGSGSEYISCVFEYILRRAFGRQEKRVLPSRWRMARAEAASSPASSACTSSACSRSLRLGDAASSKQLYAARSWKEGSLGSRGLRTEDGLPGERLEGLGPESGWQESRAVEPVAGHAARVVRAAHSGREVEVWGDGAGQGGGECGVGEEQSRERGEDLGQGGAVPAGEAEQVEELFQLEGREAELRAEGEEESGSASPISSAGRGGSLPGGGSDDPATQASL